MAIKAHLHGLFIAHFRALNRQFLPIQKVNQKTGHSTSSYTLTKAQRRLHFGLPLLLILFVVTYGTFYLPFEASAADHHFDLQFWSFQNFFTNPFLVTHQMVPPSFWRRFDVASTFTVAAACLIFLTASLREDLDPQYQRRSPRRFEPFQRRIPLLIWGSILPFFLIAMSFYYVSILSNGRFRVTPTSVIYWLLLFPAWIFYLFYAVLGFQLYIIVSSRLLRIRQLNLLAKLRRFTAEVGGVESGKPSKKNVWFSFLKANARLLHICAHIGESSRLNNPVLSILVPVLYALRECATIDRVNDQMEGSLRKFNFAYARQIQRKRRSSSGVTHFLLERLLKAELLQTADRLKPYTYCVFGYFRIVSTSYFSIIVYASTYFMFIFKSELRS
ncbi:hypothetical protein TYRP_021041 [Tyrophagus putrescentiae]|nr:hypothetical protein TYRP_021041 [Tyrophagus putrescentiae]